MESLFDDIITEEKRNSVFLFDENKVKSVISEIKMSDIIKISLGVLLGSTIGSALGVIVSTAVRELIVPKEIKLLDSIKKLLKI